MKRKFFFEYLSLGFFVIAAVAILLPHYLYIGINPNDLPPLPKKNDDITTQDTIFAGCPARVHTIRWRDYVGRNFDLTFSICKTDYFDAAKNRNAVGFNSSGPFAREYDYATLSKFDVPLLKNISSQLEEKAIQYQLSAPEKMAMVISMVQNIEYALVHPQSCESIRAAYRQTPNEDDFMYQWHFNVPPYTPNQGRQINLCEENIDKFGVLSPLEFMYLLQGDCDSRTTLLYTLLSEMGFKVAILNSDVKRHSILGVQTNAYDGIHFQDDWYGARYLVWETTTSLAPGVFPNFKNSEWKIVLKN